MDIPTNWDDVVDSRDIVARVAELVEERDAYTEDQPNGWWPGVYPEEFRELQQLTELLGELRDVGGDSPEDGMTLVRESHWVNYAQELAEDVCEIDFSQLTWPLTCIDWEQAADELRMDYTTVTWDGVDFYVGR